MKRHIVVLQQTGDYAGAFAQLRAHDEAQHPADRYLVQAIAALVDSGTAVTSVCCRSATPNDLVLPNGVRSITLGLASAGESRLVARRVDDLQPTHLLLRSPMLHVLGAARRSATPVVAIFSDSFLQRGFLARLRHQLLARELNDPNVLVVGNHGRNAARNLVTIGVRPEKVVPWYWPQAPSTLPPKEHPGRGVWHLVYVGPIDRRKGLADAVEAVALLRDGGDTVRLQCFGDGDIPGFRGLAASRGVQAAVDFVRKATHAQVAEALRRCDAVLLPSRHSDTEGLPLAVYDALRSRTPVVASDHPMYEGILVDGESAVVFRAGDAAHLTRAVATLMESTTVYETLSRNAQDAWNGLLRATPWGDLVAEWLGPDRDHGEPAPASGLTA